MFALLAFFIGAVVGLFLASLLCVARQDEAREAGRLRELEILKKLEECRHFLNPGAFDPDIEIYREFL